MYTVQLPRTADRYNKNIFRPEIGTLVEEPFVFSEWVLPSSFSDRSLDKTKPPFVAQSAIAFVSNHAVKLRTCNWISASQISSRRSGIGQSWQSSRHSKKRKPGKWRTSFPGFFRVACSLPTPEIDILSLTDSWVAVNKPPGMLVHRTKLYHANTNETYLVDHVSRLVSQRSGFPITVKPVQRLDRPTSGVILFALGDSSNARRLQATLQSPDTEKIYWAIASGADMPERWVNEHPLTDLTGKNRKQRSARTEIRQLARLNVSDVSVITARIYTGKRHQIRRHLSNSHHPILGDTSYGKGGINRKARTNFGVSRCCLHAWCLTFKDPVTHQPVRVEVAIPDDLRKVLQYFPDFVSDCTSSTWNATWDAM